MSTVVIGIDPGSRFTGYGVITDQKGEQTCIAHGRIPVKGKTTAERLYYIYYHLKEIISNYQPNEMAIEQVFFHRNAQSALKLGQARGAAMVAAASLALPVAEYSPKQIKQAAVGYGGADKSQVQHMVRALLKLKETPEVDAADALAIAICHCQTRRLARRISATSVE
ncbi:MAG: crossover junction endodeoxyribonuclease RuvC [Coxiellaceae bacterium]|nr:crossover junction endodeoxyribonuclease RuvC [Coxiellaceae bacterium]